MAPARVLAFHVIDPDGFTVYQTHSLEDALKWKRQHEPTGSIERRYTERAGGARTT